ncbi:MAG: P-loop ATPase, Sll1717 family [Flavobacteriales bacterium]
MISAKNQSLGFKKNPFSKFSAEEELEFHEEIFYQPLFYETLLDDLETGTSRFILGQRGHGKSSVIHKLKIDLQQRRIFTIVVDRFDDVAIEKNKIELLNLVLSEFVAKLVVVIDKNQHLLDLLEEDEKKFLCLLLKLFFKPIAHTEYLKAYNHVENVNVKNWFRRIWNRIVTPANSTINSAILVTSTIVAEHFGIQKYGEFRSPEYFGKIEEIDVVTLTEEELKTKKDKRSLKEILDKANRIVKKCGFRSSVVLFDKVDEFQDLDQDVLKISAFVEDILTDTELLLQNDIAIAFSLWSELKPILARKVRFDKFKEIDISWKKSDMQPLIDKRIKHFSTRSIKLDQLIKTKTDVDILISISNNSPRDLISCLSDIYDFQDSKSSLTHFESNAVSKGFIKFAKRYDYFSVYPSRTGKNKDVLTMINRLLRNKKSTFGIGDMNETFNQKTRWSDKNCIEPMLKYRLIKQDDKLGPNNERIYIVVDPKIRFLMSRGAQSLDG